jgi:hypothetical protein
MENIGCTRSYMTVLNSGVYIISKELNQDPEMFKSFYGISIESFHLLVDFEGPQVPKNIKNFVQLC